MCALAGCTLTPLNMTTLTPSYDREGRKNLRIACEAGLRWCFERAALECPAGYYLLEEREYVIGQKESATGGYYIGDAWVPASASSEAEVSRYITIRCKDEEGTDEEGTQ